MKKLSLQNTKRWKKTGVLLCLLLAFVILSASFLQGQNSAHANPLDKKTPLQASRGLVLGKGNPLKDDRKKEIEEEQKKLETPTQKEKTVSDTAPTGTESDHGTSGIGKIPTEGKGQTDVPNEPSTGEDNPQNPEQENPEPDPGNDGPSDDPGEDTSKNPVIFSSLRNGDSWNGPLRGFSVYADDYQGRHIKRGNFSVYANGEKLYGSGDQYNANYQMNTKEGTNTVSITVTDSYGVSATREYTFTGYPDAPAAERGTAYITLDIRTLGGGYLFQDYPVTLYEGETMPYVVVRALEANGYTVSYTGNKAYGFYLAGISKPGLSAIQEGYNIPPPILAKLEEINSSWNGFSADDTLREKEFYEWAGWVYVHEGEYLGDLGMSDRVVTDDDHVTIAFTMYNGAEYSGYWFSGSW